MVPPQETRVGLTAPLSQNQSKEMPRADFDETSERGGVSPMALTLPAK